MPKQSLLHSINYLIFIATLSVASPINAQEVTGSQMIDALEKLNGVTQGERRAHIIGICIEGNFVGNQEVQRYSTSPLFSGKSISVSGRLSIAGGNPKAPDTARAPRGMALEFQLPDGVAHHFVMQNIPIFFASTPESFYDFVKSNMPDPNTGKPDQEKLKALRINRPDTIPLSEYMAKNNPPASYATSDFYSIHAFKLINQQNVSTIVKWRFVPQAGVVRLTDAEMTTVPNRFLDADLLNRLKQGPIKWDMVLTIGKTGDEEINPTVYWPADRQSVQAGTLSITDVTPQKGASCEKKMFSPTVLSNGFAPSADPILNFRQGVYGVSFSKRMTNQ